MTSHASGLQEVGDLGYVMTLVTVSICIGSTWKWRLLPTYLDYNVLGETVDLYVLVLLVQEYSQLISQRRQISGDLSYRRQMQVASSLVVSVDGQVLSGRARDMVSWRGKFQGDVLNGVRFRFE